MRPAVSIHEVPSDIVPQNDPSRLLAQAEPRQHGFRTISIRYAVSVQATQQMLTNCFIFKQLKHQALKIVGVTADIVSCGLPPIA
jgi:hypothetical protein